MPLFHRESPEEKQQRESANAAAELEAKLQERSIQSLSTGGLPARAQERIAQIREAVTSGAGVALYSSDLSVNEFLLARQLGYRPIGLVAGSCMYHIGWNAWTYTGELDAQTSAMSSAANTAISRLLQETQGMGAMGAVGVRLEIRRPEWGAHLVEVVALGTAIGATADGATPEPFVCGLSGQEYCTLLRSGSRPVGIAFGNSTYYIYTSWSASMQNMSWYNQEMEAYTRSIYDAQRFAFGRMHAKAQSLRAHGIVGVHFDHTLHKIARSSGDDSEREDYVIEYIAWGTAIVEAPATVQIQRPAMVLDLEDVARVKRVTAGSK